MKKKYFCKRCRTITSGEKNGSESLEYSLWATCIVVWIFAAINSATIINNLNALTGDIMDLEDSFNFLANIILNVGVLITFLAALLYTGWRNQSTSIICDKCKSTEIIPEDKNEGRQKFEEILSKKIQSANQKE